MIKKVIPIVTLLILLSFKILWAGQADEFTYDRQQFVAEFAELNQLEQTVTDHGFITFSEMQAENILTPQLSNLVLAGNMMDPALGIPGFWWGCILGPIGILAVYIISEKDEVETKKALTGCLVAGGAELIFAVVYFVLIFSYAATTGI